VIAPLAAVAIGAIVYPFDFLVRMFGLGGAGGLVGVYTRLADRLFAPSALPTWLPRLVVIVLGLAALTIAVETIVTIVTAVSSSRRRQRGSVWWRGLKAPLSSREVLGRARTAIWDLVQGGSQAKQPSEADLSGRYVDLLADESWAARFRELVIAAHDLDSRRDLVFALVDPSRRSGLFRRTSTTEADVRRAEIIDLSAGGQRIRRRRVGGALPSRPSRIR
jgi:hypothetical protein